MHKKLLFPTMVLFVLSCSSLIVSVEAASMWTQAYGGTGNDWAYSVVETSEGGFAIAGTTHSFAAGSFPGVYPDVWLVRTDALGNMQWNKTYGGQFGGWGAYSLVATADGGYALAGYSNPIQNDYWLIKTDASGNMEWNQTYGDPSAEAGFEEAHSLVATADGGYVLIGNIGLFSEIPRNSLLVKTDALGNMQWNKTYVDGDAYSLIATSDGGYALASYTRSFGAGGDDFWLVKTNEFGVYPEYSSWLVPILMLTATAFIMINKKRLRRARP